MSLLSCNYAYILTTTSEEDLRKEYNTNFLSAKKCRQLIPLTHFWQWFAHLLKWRITGAKCQLIASILCVVVTYILLECLILRFAAIHLVTYRLMFMIRWAEDALRRFWKWWDSIPARQLRFSRSSVACWVGIQGIAKNTNVYQIVSILRTWTERTWNINSMEYKVVDASKNFPWIIKESIQESNERDTKSVSFFIIKAQCSSEKRSLSPPSSSITLRKWLHQRQEANRSPPRSQNASPLWTVMAVRQSDAMKRWRVAGSMKRSLERDFVVRKSRNEVWNGRTGCSSFSGTMRIDWTPSKAWITSPVSIPMRHVRSAMDKCSSTIMMVSNIRRKCGPRGAVCRTWA